MAREIKDGKLVNFYMSINVLNELNRYCKKSGLTKTMAVERFITKGIKEERKGEANIYKAE